MTTDVLYVCNHCGVTTRAPETTPGWVSIDTTLGGGVHTRATPINDHEAKKRKGIVSHKELRMDFCSTRCLVAFLTGRGD